MHVQEEPTELTLYIPTLLIKKKSLKKLAVGDIIPLHSTNITLDIVDGTEVVAHGIYGHYHSEPSILVNGFPKEQISREKIKKYDTIKVCLGHIEKSQLEEKKIIKIDQKSKADASIYSRERLLAEANLVQIEDTMALQIEEVM